MWAARTRGPPGGLPIVVVVPLDGCADMELTDQMSDGTGSGGASKLVGRLNSKLAEGRISPSDESERVQQFAWDIREHP